MTTQPFSLEIGFDAGHMVGFAPEIGVRDSVRLSDMARKMAARGEIVASGELYQYLDSLGDVEASGKIAKKIKAATKKAAKKVVKASQAVVKNKLVKGIYNTVKAAVPQPFKAGITVAEKGVQFAKKAAKAGSKQSKAAPIVSRLAAGKITPAAASIQAKKLGVDPEEVKAAAITTNIARAAQNGDQGAQAVVEAVEKIESAETGDPTEAVAFGAEAKIREAFPDAQIMTVTAPDGSRRLTAVIPVS